MFKVFNRKKKQVDLLENPISPVIVNELGGIGELTFSVPSTYKHLELEGYIQVENDHEYVIKEIVTHGTNRDVVCMLNIEEVLGMAWSKFISRDNTLMKCAELVLSGTRWRAINKSTCNVKRNLYGTVTNSYNLLQMMCTVYNVEFIFDTYNKTVTFVDKVGKDAGVYFINDINLKQLNVDTHTHKYITRVIPVGKDGLTIESVNNGKNYLENKTYTTKNIYGIWQSDKHDNPKALMDDARRFLDEMAIPYETYEVVVDDLYALKGYDEFQYGLGDIVTIIDGDTETRIQQRIIQRTYNLLEPDKDTIHIANKDATFEDYYKRLQTIADMTQSVIGSDGTISGGSISDGTVSGDKLENDSITSDHIQSGSIESTHIKAEQILADHIMSNQITTNHLVANSITSDHIQANSIDTKHLKANTITSDHIQANTINSNHISANTITSGHIQSGAITAGSGIIAEGAIGNAQISKIDAGKIEAGTIDTSKVTIQGANGHLRLKGNRMQVFQGVGNQAKERVSVGDVNGDGTVYGLRVRGADGQTILLDENGVKSEGITNGSITNDKINEGANIDGAKLNINSVINRINTDGTEVIQGTKVEVDGTNLGVKLSEITNKQTSDGERISQAQAQITANQNAIKLKVDEQTYTTDKNAMTSKLEKNTSEISTMKGQIALKVEQTDIENAKNELTGMMDNKISSAKAELKVTTDGISQKVGKLETTTTTLSGKVDTANTNATSAKNTANTANNNANQALTQITTTNNKLASIESNVNGITSRVSNVENKQTTIDGKVSSLESRMSTAESKITETAITNTVKKNFYTKNDIDSKGYQTSSQVQQTVNGLEVKVSQSGGYNLLKNSAFANNSFDKWWTWGTVTRWTNLTYYKEEGDMYIANSSTTDVGGLWQTIETPILPNTEYTLSVLVSKEVNVKDGYFAMEYQETMGGSHFTSQIINLTFDNKRHSYTFTTPNDSRIKYAKCGFRHGGSNSESGGFLIRINKPCLTTGRVNVWSPHPNEIYDGITTIDKDGITVSNSSSSTHTQIDSSSFRVENNTGGTVAEFSQNSQIPNLNAGIITANEVYANNMARKSTYVKNYYVAGGYGNDKEGAGGSWSNPCKTVQYVLDNYIEDILDYDVNIYVGESVPGWTCKSKSGKGVITFLIENDCIVRDPLYLDNCTNRVVVNGYAEKKGTFMTGIVVTGCHNFDIGWVSFRGKNWAHSKGSCNIFIRDGSKGLVRFNDFNGCSFAIIVENNSELWVFGNRGSDITHYIGISSYTTIYGMRSGTDTCPDFTGYYYADAGHSNLYHIHDGANYTKTPSIGWSPSYTPTQKTQTWSFNKIWSDETLHGWSDRQELIQGYASTWNTGRWTGYMQMTDGMTGIRNTISGGTNLSGRIYVQRTSSSGNSTGSKLCLYASDGTLITNSTSINRSQGVWVSLSSSIIQKIQSGAITYFYLKADSNNTATYFKCESNAKIEITYTK